MAGEPVRLCVGCGQRDDHPRHVIYMKGNPGGALWHHDCHVLATGCESCARKLALVGTDESADGVKGAELRELFIEHRDVLNARAEG